MFRKIFNKSAQADTVKPSRLKQSEVEPVLKAMAEQIRQAQWLALITTDGLFLSDFPGLGSQDEDRVSAMSAAAFSLGERISGEMGNGRLTHTIIAGDDSILLVKIVNEQMLLTLNLWPDVSIDETLQQVEQTLPLLLKLIEEGG